MKIVIVGGSHSGIVTALRAHEEYPEAEIVIFDKRAEVSFVSQGIVAYLAGDKSALFQSSYTSVRALREAGFVFHSETIVDKIDTEAKTVSYHAMADGVAREETYEKLVFATGSYPKMPAISYDEDCKLFFLKSIDDAIEIDEFLKKAKSVVVIGGGMTGLEIARITNIRQVETTFVNGHDYLLSRYVDEPAGRLIEQQIAGEGIRVVNGTWIEELRSEGGQTVFSLADGTEVRADGVIFSVGFRPNSQMLADQVALGERGAIVVDEYMQTSATDVFAVGDASTTWVERAGKNLYLPHASDAVRDGEIAAINLAGPKQKICPTQATYHVPMPGLVVAMTGQTLSQARQAGLDCEMVYMENPHLSGHATSHIWMVYERDSHRIAGLQCVGKTPDLAAYANIYSLAIQQNMTVEQMEFTDLYFEIGYFDPTGINRILARLVREHERG